MTIGYFISHPMVFALGVICLCVAYFFLFKKMNIKGIYAILPFVAEARLTRVLYPKMRTFWRPFFITAVLCGFAAYLNPLRGTGRLTARIYLLIAQIVYSFFMFRLYWRLSKRFGRGLFFALLTSLIPPLGIAILASPKFVYQGPPAFKAEKSFGPVFRFLSRVGLVIVSAVEIVLFMGAIGFFTIRAYPPRILAQHVLSDTLEKTKDVQGTGTVVTREEAMGEDAALIASMPTSRDKFFPDHSNDQSVAVLVYLIGSDLEDRMGLSSANITQMIDATKKGPGVTFVVEAGGSQRWFTNGIADASYGRYIIHDGKLEKVMDLSDKTCMSEPSEFADFLVWARDAYPADRRMLVFWDHGNGFGMGYGMDAINKRKADIPLLRVTELCEGIEQSGMKFDMIGFDACLMQDIEVAALMEPYADYYLASEETEGGFGWFYTSAFGMLAQNPGMSTEDFGKEMIACYDPYNTIIADGTPDTKATLSFVDLTLAKPAYQKVEEFYNRAHEVILSDSSSYAEISVAAARAYAFSDNVQGDLIDFLTILGKIDYDDSIYSDEQIADLVRTVRACILYRNGDSAAGINGMAQAFPYKAVEVYYTDHDELVKGGLESERSFFDDFFSIMAAQRKKSRENTDNDSVIAQILTPADLTAQEWYVAGFEDYETQEALTNIPLIQQGNAYQIDLPDKAWDIIVDVKLAAYQKVEDGMLRYLGTDTIGSFDENNRPMLEMDGKWVHIEGQLVCYEETGARETEEGIIYTGEVNAVLNGEDKIRLYIEWDPVTGNDNPATGHVVGYNYTFEDSPLFNLLSGEAQNAISKGVLQLQPGDTLSFLFDYFDAEGNRVKTETYGKSLRVNKSESLTVQDLPLTSCDVVFTGVLEDAYQRTMTTEQVEMNIE